MMPEPENPKGESAPAKPETKPRASTRQVKSDPDKRAKKPPRKKKLPKRTGPPRKLPRTPLPEMKEAEKETRKEAVKKPSEWNPNIVVFACNWCSYAGADTAGVSRMEHEPHFRIIRVMCSGRVQPAFVLKAFEKGADGVLVSGCHFGDCHYIFGNERAAEQFAKTVKMVKLLGLEENRLRLEWISAAEGARFAQVINEFTEQVRSLGPSPLSGNHLKI